MINAFDCLAPKPTDKFLIINGPGSIKLKLDCDDVPFCEVENFIEQFDRLMNSGGWDQESFNNCYPEKKEDD